MSRREIQTSTDEVATSTTSEVTKPPALHPANDFDVAATPETSRPAPQLLAKQSKVVGLWVFIALLSRVVLLWSFNYVISPDGVWYVTLGRNLVAGNFRDGLTTYYPPLYPLLVGLASLLFRDAEFAGRFVSVLAGTLLVIPVYRLTQKLYGAKAAGIVAAIVALHPLLIYYSTAVLTESTYTLLFTCVVVAGWSALSEGKQAAYVFAGAALGACYLLKPEAALFLPLLLLLVLGRAILMRVDPLKQALKNALLLFAAFIVPAAPYLIYLRRQTGAWVLSGKVGAHLWQGARRAGGDFGPVVAPLLPNVTTAVVQLTKALRFEYELFNLIFPPIFVVFVTLGLFRSSWTRGRVRQELYIFLFIVATLLGYAVTLPNIRFLIPLLPLMLIWMAKGIIEFENWTTETIARKEQPAQPTDKVKVFPHVRRVFVPWIVPAVVGVLLVSLFPLFIYLMRGDKWSDYYGQKLAAVWIKTHDASTPVVIMSTTPVPAFYASARYVPLVDEDYRVFLEHARREGASHIIVNQRDFRYMPLLSTLLESDQQHPGLRLDYKVQEDAEQTILVYAVDKTNQ